MVTIYNRLLQLSAQVWNPANPPELLTYKEEYKKQAEHFRDKLDSAITKLEPLFEDDCTTDKAMSAWNKVFDHEFWAETEEDESETEDHSGVDERAHSNTIKPTLGRIDHQQPILWPFDKQCWVRLHTYTYHNKKIKLGGLGSDGRTIPSGIDLKFEVTTKARQPYQVFWQVVNTGQHAEFENGRRGNIFPSKNSNPDLHWEESLYTGKHWIECFIVKDDVCVARSGKFFVNIYNPQFPSYR